MAKIRIEVQQATGHDSVAFEADAAWDGDVAWSLMSGIDETIEACERLGISLYQFARQRVPAEIVQFQEDCHPPGMRCLTMKVAFDVGSAGPDHPALRGPTGRVAS